MLVNSEERGGRPLGGLSSICGREMCVVSAGRSGAGMSTIMMRSGDMTVTHTAIRNTKMSMAANRGGALAPPTPVWTVREFGGFTDPGVDGA